MTSNTTGPAGVKFPTMKNWPGLRPGANVTGTGTFAPGLSPGQFTIVGNFTPAGPVVFEVNPPALVPGSDYDQYVVTGAVDLSGATLTFAGAAGVVAPNQLVTLIANDAADPTVPSANPPQGTQVTIGGNTYFLFYNGGDGNDVVLDFNQSLGRFRTRGLAANPFDPSVRSGQALSLIHI